MHVSENIAPSKLVIPVGEKIGTMKSEILVFRIVDLLFHVPYTRKIYAEFLLLNVFVWWYFWTGIIALLHLYDCYRICCW